MDIKPMKLSPGFSWAQMDKAVKGGKSSREIYSKWALDVDKRTKSQPLKDALLSGQEGLIKTAKPAQPMSPEMSKAIIDFIKDSRLNKIIEEKAKGVK